MEIEIFVVWIVLILALMAYGGFKRASIPLLLSGLFFFAFSATLAGEGLNVVNGFDAATGEFTFKTISVANDTFMQILWYGSIPISFTISIFAIKQLLSGLFTERKNAAISET